MKINNMKIKHDRGDHIVEYDLKIALLRITIFILFIFLIYFTFNFIITDKKQSQEIKEILESDIDENKLIDSITIEKNSRGHFKSLKENIYVEGNIEIKSKNSQTYLQLGNNFKITNNPNLKLILATSPQGKSQIEIGNLLGNIGRQEFELPQKIDFREHKYVVIWNYKTNEAYAYSIIY